MKTLTGIAVTLTVIILIYTVRKPALKWAFMNDLPETPEGWQPKMITWINGVRQP